MMAAISAGATQPGQTDREYVVPLSAQPSPAWVEAFDQYWAKGQGSHVTVSTAVIGSAAKVVGAEVRVKTHAGSGDFDTNVRSFVVDAVNHANQHS
jgi:hypothetical protein